MKGILSNESAGTDLNLDDVEGLLDGESREKLSETVIEDHRDLYSSDREMIESGALLNQVGDKVPIFGEVVRQMPFAARYAKNIGRMFEAHDEAHKFEHGELKTSDPDKKEEAYRQGGLAFAKSFTHLNLDDRVEAGFSYVDALFKKDEMEEEYLDQNDEIDKEKMAENDGLRPENIDIDIDNMKADFERSDLGDWGDVYDKMRNMTSLTVENFYHGERAEELADYEALLRTLSWRHHKVGDERDHNRWRYESILPGAHKIHTRVAVQDEEYPTKHSPEGATGPGLIPSLYLDGAEVHDEARDKDSPVNRYIGLCLMGLSGGLLNKYRADRIGDLDRDY